MLKVDFRVPLANDSVSVCKTAFVKSWLNFKRSDHVSADLQWDRAAPHLSHSKGPPNKVDKNRLMIVVMFSRERLPLALTE